MPGLRTGIDASPSEREAYRAIGALVPPGRTVLSRATYDTFYYSRRYATWPVPWGDTAGQLSLFTERDPDRFLATLDRLSIDYALLPAATRAPRFNGANHTQSFVACVAALVDRGRLRVLWQAQGLVLVGRPE